MKINAYIADTTNGNYLYFNIYPGDSYYLFGASDFGQ